MSMHEENYTQECYSVSLKDFYSISEKCYKAIDHNGHEELIPKSQFFGIDYRQKKGIAVFLTKWILKRKKIEYSGEPFEILKSNSDFLDEIEEIIKHEPPHLEPEIGVEADESLIR